MGNGKIAGAENIHSNEDIKRVAKVRPCHPHHLEHHPVRQPDVDDMCSGRHCSTGCTYLRRSDGRQSEIIHNCWRNRALRRSCVVYRFVLLSRRKGLTRLKLKWLEMGYLLDSGDPKMLYSSRWRIIRGI